MLIIFCLDLVKIYKKTIPHTRCANHLGEVRIGTLVLSDE